MDDLLMVLTAWFLIGIVSAIWIYFDLRKRSSMNWLWVVIGFLLSFVGLLAYILAGRKKDVTVGYDPGDEYSKPDYHFEGEPQKVPEVPKQPVDLKVKKEERKRVEPLEGCPRCPKCGAAISAYDLKCWDCGAQLRAQ